MTIQWIRQWGHIPRLVLTALLVVTILAACGDDDDAEPTATAVVETTPTATVASTSGTPVAGQQAAPRTVGELADRVGVAWGDVTSYRAVTTQGMVDGPPIELPVPPGTGTPVPLGSVPESTQAFIDEIVMPDRRHQLESAGGQVSEYLTVDGRMYVRGRFGQVAIRPDLDAETWVDLDPARISPDSPIGFFSAGFMPPGPAYASPLSDLLPETRAHELTPVGEVEVDGRMCQSYKWVETAANGEPLTREFAVDANNLPCLLEFRTETYVSRTTYGAYNEPIVIEAPTDAVPVGQTGIMPEQDPEGTPVAGADAAPTPPTPGG